MAGVAAVCTIHVLVFTVAIKQPQLPQSETNRLYVANRCATFISFGPYMTIIVAQFFFCLYDYQKWTEEVLTVSL